jgi:hypothetical protein
LWLGRDVLNNLLRLSRNNLLRISRDILNNLRLTWEDRLRRNIHLIRSRK